MGMVDLFGKCGKYYVRCAPAFVLLGLRWVTFGEAVENFRLGKCFLPRRRLQNEIWIFLFLGGLVVLSTSAMAASRCQSVLAGAGDTFQALETAGSCDVGNVLFSSFNTSFTASSVLVATNGGASSVLGSILGFTYNYVGGTLPGGTNTIGWTATFDSTAGVGCPAGFSSCGIDAALGQLHVSVPNPAVVNTVYSSGFVGSASVRSE